MSLTWQDRAKRDHFLARGEPFVYCKQHQHADQVKGLDEPAMNIRASSYAQYEVVTPREARGYSGDDLALKIRLTRSSPPADPPRSPDVLVPLIHRDLQRADAAPLARYIAAGEKLLEAKKQIPHGEFGKWVKYQVRISHTTARFYMRLAEFAEKETEVSFSSMREFRRTVLESEQEASDEVPIADERKTFDVEQRDYRCPRCAYAWNGNPTPPSVALSPEQIDALEREHERRVQHIEREVQQQIKRYEDVSERLDARVKELHEVCERLRQAQEQAALISEQEAMAS